ncbi:MAG: OmpA family protein [Saprospiraceae bacterium]
MKRNYLLLLFLLIGFFSSRAQEPVLTLHFETNKATLDEQSKQDLREFLSGNVPQGEAIQIELTAHTDSRGSDTFNERLSEKRGETVRNALIAQGISAPSINMKPFGEIHPTATNESEEGREQNRRVEVRLISAKTFQWEQYNKVRTANLKFKAEKGFRFESPNSGTQIEIPAGSLVYPDGRPVQGEVAIQFREYRTMADYLASEIPMHYADERGAFFFNSGGMFELAVSQNGQELQMAPGKEYTVSFIPTHELADASLYAYDENSRSWEFVAQESMDDRKINGKAWQAPDLPPEVSSTDVTRDNLNAQAEQFACLPTMIPLPAEGSPVASVKNGVLFGRQLAHGGELIPEWFLRNQRKSDGFFINGFDRSDIRLVRRVDKTERFYFEDMNELFTELEVFKDCYFERLLVPVQQEQGLGIEESVDEIFRNPNRRWVRVRIFAIDGNKCTIALSDDAEEIRIKAKLSRSAEKEYDQAFEPEEIFKEYTRLRLERQQSLSEKIASWRDFLLIAPLFKTPDEWCLDARTWLAFFDANRSMMQERYDGLIEEGMATNDTLIINTLKRYRERLEQLYASQKSRREKINKPGRDLEFTVRLSGFGLYNCDQIFRLNTQPLMVDALYKSADGEFISPVHIRIVDRETGMLFSRSGGSRMYKMPGRKMDIVATTYSGAVYHLPADEYAALDFKNDQLFTFTMNEVTSQVANPDGWETLLGL